MVPANNLKTTRQLVISYPGMKKLSIKIFSAAILICGMASIGIQTVTLVIFLETFDRYYVYFPSDVVGHGIWGGMLYLTAGSFGFAVAFMRKKTLVGTVVTSSLSIFASFLTSLLSAGAASSGVYSSCYRKFGYSNSICDTWLGLEWALMMCGIVAFISSTSLTILASGSLCTCCRKHNTIADMQESVVTLQGVYVDQQVPAQQQV
ncbi:uncharacterized protein LOC124350980 isoform X2 [Daphnia pulicaria]|uniref:uncharacterized protein LOC124350980 isoform X2 n=1 Tax=Daphnia pulicaria TaxID=35523 RepID=UPI001EEAC33F|nr:uncharacterized protein LOC124350980 isoform X2 [Daphnia pulicaria]